MMPGKIHIILCFAMDLKAGMMETSESEIAAVYVVNRKLEALFKTR